MYLAQTDSKKSQTPFYINLFENIIEGESDSVLKREIDNAIRDASEISKEKKEIYTIKKEHYFLVTLLLMNYSEKLHLLNKTIPNTVYNDIINILKEY